MDVALPQIKDFGIFNASTVFKNVTVTPIRDVPIFEIELIIEDGGVSYIGESETNVRRGTIIFAKPGQTRHTRLPYKCYYMHFSLPKSDMYSRLMKLPDFIKTDKYDEYCKAFQKICSCSVDKDASEFMLYGGIFELIYMLIKDSEKQSLKSQIGTGSYKSIRSATAFIENNITSDLSLTALSAFSGYSPTHFHKLFKFVTGETLHNYVERRRIEKAANLLVATDYTLSQVAYECGFSSQSYFSYAFRRVKNMTPREYAKKVLARYDAKKD